MRLWRMLGGLVMLALLAMINQASAHELRPGYLEITETGDAAYQVTWKAPLMSGRPLAVEPAFPPGCTLSGETRARSAPRAISTTFGLQCETSLAGTPVTLAGLDATLSDIIVRYIPLSGPTETHRATPDAATIMLTGAQSSLAVARTYTVLGIEHIFSGIDHLLFVLALVLLVRGTRRLVETVTAFTLAHSLTLIATTLGLVSLPSAPVEAVIALSIVFLAREIVLRDPQAPRLSERKPWLIAFAFGLLHGFGFAGALRAIGLPSDAIPLALLTFNLGVEIGQLVFVGICLTVLFGLRRLVSQAWLNVPANYGIGIIATVWLIERTLA